VNSGSYFTALLIVVFGITTFVGLGGSFLITGLAVGLIDTKDLGSTAPFFFFATGWGATGGACLTSGLCGGFAACEAAGFLEATVFLGADLAAIFFDTGFSFFLLAAFLAAGFARGFFATFLGADLVGFFEAGFFLLAIHLAFF